MTDVFRSEILAVVMQQIVDEPVLPVLFLRTVSAFRYFRLQLFRVIRHTRSFRPSRRIERWLALCRPPCCLA